MDYIKVGRLNDFENKDIISYSIMGRFIAVVQQKGEELFAIEAGCKHQRADLTKGKIDGLIVTCPRHHWQYDLSTGKCLNHESVDLRRHDLKIEDGDIYVSLHPVD